LEERERGLDKALQLAEDDGLDYFNEMTN